MPSRVTTHKSSKSAAKRPTGVTKRAPKTSRKTKKVPKNCDEYFWYTSSDGVDRLATSSSTLSEVPRQVNDYPLDASIFADHPYPTTFPPGASWPPKTAQDVLHSLGDEFSACVGDRCYTDDVCEESYCDHTFDNWKAVTSDWQDHFELRMTEGRGIGVYTKRAFKRNDVLGFYAGTIIPSDYGHASNAYLMEVPVGKSQEDMECEDTGSDSGYGSSSSESSNVSSDEPIEETIMIDGEKQGNWTRFINHSCAPHCHFRVRRVGTMRIMTIEAIRNIPAGVEMTVSYGESYYGPQSSRICRCGTKNCVSRERNSKKEEGMWPKGKPRVKKCRRTGPP
ncbi:hypothetical protein NX059_002235 [Plenodomus lindquistii]|nr:hypothetical protein NX059_002235 [Plenodomus lindquistii]